MSRMESGGAVLDQLRDRIVTGLYFGKWQPGERLPSIRDIADAELVDRKTAAAAYHRLAEEGLVEVRSRSGVFLREDRSSSVQGWGPMEQMQRRWLRNTFDGGRALGLDTAGMVRLFQSIAAVEARPLPVLVDDGPTARMIAGELSACRGLDARPYRLAEVDGDRGRLAGAAMVVTTPYHSAQVRRLTPALPVVTATLSLEPLYGLMARVTEGAIVIAVPSVWIADRVAYALSHRPAGLDRTRFVVIDEHSDAARLRGDAACVFVWPGCGDIFRSQDGDACVEPVRLLSDSTLDAVTSTLLDVALGPTSGSLEPGHRPARPARSAGPRLDGVQA